VSRLNPEQLQAAEHTSGPALVLAGPGTGKTTTLVGRYAYLVGKGVDPSLIFVSTFTRKAASEVGDRIGAATGIRVSGLPIGTFHSYCYRLTGARDVIAEPARYAVVRSCMPDWHGDLRSVLEAIDRFKDSLITPSQAVQRALQSSKKDRAELVRVANAYECYQKVLAENGQYDFGDLVVRSIEILRSGVPPDHRFAHLLIDEYQDINPAQNALIEALLGAGGQLWVVGDDDQAIYGWRGSDVRFINSFARRYEGAATYRLKRNYRSSDIIVTASQALISNNSARLPKRLQSESGVRSRPICLVGRADERDEAEWVREAIQKLLLRDTRPEDIAILLRTNVQTIEFETALDRARIPFVIRGGSSFWELPVVKALLAAIWRAFGLGSPPWSGPKYLKPILDEITARNVPFPEMMAALSDAAIGAMPRSMPSESQIQWESAATRLSIEGKRFADPQTFLTHCREATAVSRRKKPDRGHAVISTVHQAKGLEWDAVFVVGLEDGLLPHRSSDDYEEERRLAYVAASRAKEFLTLTWAIRRGGKDRVESPFVLELAAGVPSQMLDRRDPPIDRRASGARRARHKHGSRRRAKKKPKRFGKSRPSAGSKPPRRAKIIRVSHEKFGEGTVESVKGDRYVVVFDEVGRKKIISKFLKLLN